MDRYRPLAVVVSLLLLSVSASDASKATAKAVADCACGFYDAAAGTLFTESIVAYFNETAAPPFDGFDMQDYEHKYEKGWNSQFRMGASSSNLRIGNHNANSTSLEFHINPATPQHLVLGSDIRTSRQDIRYGSFRSLMRSPPRWGGGSVLTMAVKYNLTEATTLNLMNTATPQTAWASFLLHDDFPDPSRGCGYDNMTNITTSPWDFTEYRVDWTADETKYFIDDVLYLRITKEFDDKKLPSVPGALYFTHWSTGNWYSSQGPPKNDSFANVGWVRSFFNSSLMSKDDHAAFDSRCSVSDACAVDDMTLRGLTPYSPAATLIWKQVNPPRGTRLPALIIVIICSVLSALVLCNAIVRRLPFDRLRMARHKLRTFREPKPKLHSSPYAPSMQLVSDDATYSPPTPSMYSSHGPRSEAFSLNEAMRSSVWPDGERLSSAWATPGNGMTPTLRHASRENLSIRMSGATLETAITRVPSVAASTTTDPKGSGIRTLSKDLHAYFSAHPLDSRSDSPVGASSGSSVANESTSKQTAPSTAKDVDAIEHVRDEPPLYTTDVIDYATDAGKGFADNGKGFTPIVAVTPVRPQQARLEELQTGENARKNPDQMDEKQPAPPKTEALVAVPTTAAKRVDYLAGLVALSSLLVTAIHFSLTFVPAAVNPGAYYHYKSEVWAKKIIDPYLLNLIWIGPFLMTSTRFLVASYLRSGKLLGVAEKTVGRPFRLLIPITAIAMLEYFFMDSGALTWLEYLPSVTWSTWPFAVVPTTFGNFISEILELAYLIPNAAPQITTNYCTGVLWTIPVQLQGSWITLLGVVVIREIKTPWKRFGYYAFCFLMHWYALSWGTYFYFGIMLADLDLTYKWKPWLYARPWVYYPLVAFCFGAGFGGLTMDLVTQWTNVNYSTFEYGVHPDIPTGLPIMFTGANSYPQYYVPKLNGLIFSMGFQALVELSPLVQKALSFKFFVYVFPHIFTIYLIHGFIYWSLGAMICVYLSAHGFPYWLNLLVVAICCYSALVACLPLLTPVVETLGKNVTSNIWLFASQRPAPRRPTLYPFADDLLTSRGTTALDENLSKSEKKHVEKMGREDVEKAEVQGHIEEDERAEVAHEAEVARELSVQIENEGHVERP
ncbi:MAG: hypothetical protein FRX48_09601 [Lasallia pustulata]|uniref:GH16 domain-containing protein n=1 Tax=Lasallia pustulata TaxID=136370 RepID=A0A5M8PBI6_9LECA|nr:MAG: hypothetical protein FRX48_09601 [Lasallia pustulata]